jgi:hypothetical protein
VALLVSLLFSPVLLAQSIFSFVVPAFPDLTIKTRHTLDAAFPLVHNQVLYLKGARERIESVYVGFESDPAGGITIIQCDERRSIQLNADANTYSVHVMKDWSRAILGPPLREPQGADVTTTSDAVDTGERRQVGHYVARRVRTTVTVEPSIGANTPPSRTETDGWYVDLPGLGCSGTEATAYVTGEVVSSGGVADSHHYKTIGRARRGYAIEETTRLTQPNVTAVQRVELMELSESSLDLSLFDIPNHYRPALPLFGGYDMTKPDTLANRLQLYWQLLEQLTSAIFR